MSKHPLTTRQLALSIDRCDKCEGVWLDPGELSIAQLVFEASTWGLESKAFQERMAALESDPERLQRFQTAMASLPLPQWNNEDETLDALIGNLILHVISLGR